MVTILIKDEITVGGSGSLVVLDDGAPAAVVIRGPIGTGIILAPERIQSEYLFLLPGIV